ncbi:MAG: hypothetical protein RSA29_09765 [Clostridium sp.]|uniref:hypothetical protein n=1 Tax=Clostridium sp. TaxID=1506 RepID=UPI003027C0A5
MEKLRGKFVCLFVIIILFLSIFTFIKTDELRDARAYVFFNGHFNFAIKGSVTEQKYSPNPDNVAIHFLYGDENMGPISLHKSKLGLWFVQENGTMPDPH